MKSILLALIGIILYAVQNVIIDVRLKQYSTASLLLGWYVVLLPLAVGLYLYQKQAGASLVMPVGRDLVYMIVVAGMFFVADFFYIAAYTHGGNAVTITILLVLMPVVAALMKFVWVQEVPTQYHLAGFVLALLAVLCIAAGDSKRPLEITIASTSSEVPLEK